MDQTEFQRALRKFELRKAKKAEAPVKVDPALPFAEHVAPKQKEKRVELERPRPKTLEIAVSGPVNLKFSIDWAGTLLGGQMNEQTMKGLFAKYLSALGRVTPK